MSHILADAAAGTLKRSVADAEAFRPTPDTSELMTPIDSKSAEVHQTITDQNRVLGNRMRSRSLVLEVCERFKIRIRTANGKDH